MNQFHHHAPLQSIELFAGGGGMALGMREAGFEHQALVEWWAPAARVLRHNAELCPELWKPDAVLEQDVNVVVDELGDRGTVQLIAGGPPCQPFSLAGAHAGDTDERNQFPSALNVVRRLLPPLVVFENVPGLLRPTFAPYLDYVKDQLRHPDIEPVGDDELWDHHHARIRNSDSEPAYRVYQDEIDAADLGVPQSRKRVFVIAIRADVPGADTLQRLTMTHTRDRLLHEQYITGEYWGRHGLPVPDIPARLRGNVQRVKLTGSTEQRGHGLRSATGWSMCHPPSLARTPKDGQITSRSQEPGRTPSTPAAPSTCRARRSKPGFMASRAERPCSAS